MMTGFRIVLVEVERLLLGKEDVPVRCPRQKKTLVLDCSSVDRGTMLTLFDLSLRLHGCALNGSFIQ